MTKPYGLPRNERSIIAYLLRYPSLTIGMVVCGILPNILHPLRSIFMGRVLDAGLMVGNNPANLGGLIKASLMLIGIIMLLQVMRFINRTCQRMVTSCIDNDLKAGMVERIFKRPMTMLESEKVGDLMSRTQGDVAQVTSGISTTASNLGDGIILMLANLVALLVIDWRITLIVVIPIPLVAWLSKMLGKVYFKRSQQVRQAASRQNARLQQLISGMGILRVLGRETAEREQYEESCRKHTFSLLKLAQWRNCMDPLYGALSGLGMVLVIGWGAREVAEGRWTVGGFTAYFALFIAFADGSFAIPDMINTWYVAKAAWDRIHEKLTPVFSTLKAKTTEPVGGIIAENAPCLIEVRNLTFTYPGMQQPVLHSVSFCINKGQWLGVTGPVGCGKSALGLVLSGLYPYIGSILINGRELRDIPSGERAGLFGYVGHDAFLFSGTIQDNIIFGALLDDNRLAAVLNASALERDIPHFDKGLATW